MRILNFGYKIFSKFFLFKMYFETSKITAQKDLKFFLSNFFINLILVTHHVFKMGVKFDFKFFEKITINIDFFEIGHIFALGGSTELLLNMRD